MNLYCQSNAKPLVSVIIPFFSGKKWLDEAIQSVLNQTYEEKEIIVVNDGSNEDISDLIEKYDEKIIFINQVNKGAGAARNNGIAHSKGKYIAFLDSDDLWVKEKLKIQVEYMENNKHIFFLHSFYKTFGQGKARIVNTAFSRGDIFIKSLCSCRIATPCVMVRRELFDDTRFRFCETMRYGQDTYLWMLISCYYTIGCIEQPLANVRMRGSNAAKRAYVMLKAKSELWDNLNIVIKKQIREIPFIIQVAYLMCKKAFCFVSVMERHINNANVIEFMSKVLYVIPYIIFKTKAYFLRKS